VDTYLLKDLVVILLAAIGFQLVCYFLRVPAIVGFLLTGVLTGPQGLSLISSKSNVDTLAEIGIILLLFSVGMELPMHQIKALHKPFFLGGLLQVILTGLIGFAVAFILGRPIGESIFLGCLVSLSSTAIVSKILTSRYELETPYGMVSLAICLFQDVIVIPMLLLVPFLATGEQKEPMSLLLLIKNILVLTVFCFAAWKGLPYLFRIVTQKGHHELFIITILAVCFGTAFLAFELGLPVAIGAFLAGLFLANLEYRYQAMSDIVSLKEIFFGFFLCLNRHAHGFGFFNRPYLAGPSSCHIHYHC
jgi:CPA2 family monovalent cation:H+ antiporter-2